MRWLLLLFVSAACPANVNDPVFDVLIINGTVFDGTLSNSVVTNIGIVDGRIASIDAATDASTTKLINADGKFVMPGFIDPHTHARRTLANARKNANLNYLTQGVTTVFIGNDGDGVPKRRETLDEFEDQGIGSNVAFFAGHGLIRKAVMGRADRAATTDELHKMRTALADEMRAGALGLSTGLFYVPGTYADTAEVVALAKTTAEFGGVYDTHMRSESSHGDGVLAAVQETVRISREADVAVHISHIKALGKDVWGQSADIIALIEAARADGLDVTANQYPWRASGTRFSNALIPAWVKADSKARMFERLADPELAPSILKEMQRNLELRGGPDAMLVTAANSEYQGQTLAAIAPQLGTDVLNAAIQLVRNGDPSIASFVMDPADIAALAVQPWVMTGSDGSSGHPRLYGTYPKAWQDLVTAGTLGVAAFAHRSSGLVAKTFGLCKRGFIRNSYIADIVVLDPNNFKANASYSSPTELSSGVEYLIVNGVIVIDNNNYNGELPGRVVRHANCDD